MEGGVIYINKALKQVYPNPGILTKLMSAINSFVKDIFQGIAAKDFHLAHHNKQSTIASRERTLFDFCSQENQLRQISEKLVSTPN